MTKQEFMETLNLESVRQAAILRKMEGIISARYEMKLKLDIFPNVHTNDTFRIDEFNNLLSLCTDINAQNFDNIRNRRLLETAVYYNDITIAKILIDAGADVKLPVLDPSLIAKKLPILDLTISLDQNKRMHIKYERYPMVELLLDAGAEISDDIKVHLEKMFKEKTRIEVEDQLKNMHKN
jgi:hypothetical protein